MNHVFDTSALIVHTFAEPGASEVQSLIAEEQHTLFICSLSLFELAGVLKRNRASDRISTCWETYRQIAEIIPVTADLAQDAWRLRESVGRRLPMADAIIAASAQSRGATLVHRDRHLSTIPHSVIPQIRLPAT